MAFVGTGNCKGILTINGTGVRYSPRSGNHFKSWDLAGISSIIKEDEKTLVIKGKDNKSEKYNADNERDAKAVLDFWAKVPKAGK